MQFILSTVNLQSSFGVIVLQVRESIGHAHACLCLLFFFYLSSWSVSLSVMVSQSVFGQSALFKVKHITGIPTQMAVSLWSVYIVQCETHNRNTNTDGSQSLVSLHCSM